MVTVNVDVECADEWSQSMVTQLGVLEVGTKKSSTSCSWDHLFHHCELYGSPSTRGGILMGGSLWHAPSAEAHSEVQKGGIQGSLAAAGKYLGTRKCVFMTTFCGSIIFLIFFSAHLSSGSPTKSPSQAEKGWILYWWYVFPFKIASLRYIF